MGSLDEVIAMKTDEPEIGASMAWTGGTAATAGGGTDTVAEDRRVRIIR